MSTVQHIRTETGTRVSVGVSRGACFLQFDRCDGHWMETVTSEQAAQIGEALLSASKSKESEAPKGMDLSGVLEGSRLGQAEVGS